MAKLYGEIASSTLMSFDKSFARLNGQPLDSSEVYYSLDAAKTYAASAGAYIGQKIVVIENNVVTHYSIEDAAGTLKELGAKPLSDNKSIEINGNVISMHDFGKAFYKYYPETKDAEGTVTKEAYYEKVEVSDENPWKAGLEPKVVTENSQLVIGWYEPNPTTIEGVNDQVIAVQGTVTDLQQSVGAPSGEGTGATGLYKEVEDVASGVTNLEESVYGIGGTAETPVEGSIAWSVDELDRIVGLTDTTSGLSADVKAIKNDYLTSTDKNELQANIDGITLSYDENNKTIKLYSKDNTKELGSIDATPFIKDGMLADVSYNADTNTLTFKWNTEAGITEDTVVLSDIIEPYTAGNGLELNGNEFKVKVAEGNENYLTVDSNGIKLSGVAAAIASAKGEAISDAEGKIATAKQEAINDAAGKYATTGALSQLDARLDTLEAYDHSTYATKDELKTTNDKAVNNATSITNLTNRLDDIVAQGGEPNTINTIKVNGVAQTIDSEKAVDISIPTKFSEITDDSGFDARITAAQAQADKGVNDAATAQTAANKAQSEIDALESEVGTLSTTVAGHTASITNYNTRIGALEQADTTHAAEYNGLKDIVTGHTSTIASLAKQTALNDAVARITANETAISTLNTTTIPNINTEIGKKANSADVYTKSEINAITGTLEEGKSLVQMIEEAKSEASYDDTSIKALIQSNTNAIAVLNGDVNTNGSVAKIAAAAAKAEVAIVVGAAPEAMNTLEEVALWIANDKSGAAAMANDIAANKTAIAAINNETTGILAVSKKYTDDAIAGLPAASASALGLVKVDNVTIQSNEGVISVKSVSTGLLTQGAEELILCGGSAV